MLTIGPLAFVSPWVLAGLVALPVIWWLLRFTPPRPRRQPFPPFRLLLSLRRTEETPDRSPWWLTALRMLAAAIVILAFAQPILNPSSFAGDGEGPLALVIDDGWAAAGDWDERQALAIEIIDEAGRRGREVALLTTAGVTAPAIEPAEAAARAMRALAPVPHTPDRLARLAPLAGLAPATPIGEIVWICDGLDYGEGAGASFGEGLGELAPDAPLTVFTNSDEAPVWLTPAHSEDSGLVVDVLRGTGSARRVGDIAAYALNGRLIDRRPFVMDAGETTVPVTFPLPADLRNQVARLEVSGAQSAGAVTLLDERWQTRSVALVAGGSSEIAQPLLSPLYYVERALAPFAEIRRPEFGQNIPAIEELIGDGLSMLILADVGTLVESERKTVTDWVEAGGLLLRFAGPRLASATDDLLPVTLRQGGRSLGGALSWEDPQRLARFDDDSPFAGLDVSQEVAVSRQVLAEPDLTLGERTWARLEDGTPLVTSNRMGRGRIVLFHVTANAEWSNLPLSGLFVDMLSRLLRLSQSVAGSEAAIAEQGISFLAPYLILDGTGRLGAPPPTAEPFARDEIDTVKAGPLHPPGFYGPSTGRYALNTVAADDRFSALDIPSSALVRPIGGEGETALLPWLIIAAMALLAIDVIAVLALSGEIALRRTTAGIVLAALVAAGPAGAQDATQDVATGAADAFALDATLTTRLAYVVTGDREVDAISEAGLRSLSSELGNRTALEPGAPLGIVVERDEMVFFPVIYWPVLPDAEPPSEAALKRIDAYMKSGGTIFFDTRDEINALPVPGLGRETPGLAALQRILADLDIPPLTPVPANHVVTKAFYLLQSFPGRFDGGPLWVEAGAGDSQDADPAARGNADGVSSIVIGSNDYAGAWARDDTGAALLPMATGDERQREMAVRVGVNIVMYALTGNYKADQVHVPALLERLGQ